jgi:hypothetical protein
MAEDQSEPEGAAGAAPSRLRVWGVAALAVVALAAAGGVATWAGSRVPGPATAGATRTFSPLSPRPAADPPRAGADKPAPLMVTDGPSTSNGPPLGGTGEPPLPPGPPTTAATALAVRFTPSTRWDGGMVGYFTITNTLGTQVDGWRLVVTVPAGIDITATWEATMHRAGNTITFTSTSTNALIDSGATIRFGLQASTDHGFKGPVTCVINGAPCA